MHSPPSNQHSRRDLAGILFLSVLLLALGVPLHAVEVKENFPDGKMKARYNVDDKKQRMGVYEEFYPSGKLKLRGQYSLGKKSGMWITYEEKTARVLESSTYRLDLLDGSYVWNLPSGKPGIHAVYKAGAIYGPIIAQDEKGQTRRINYPHPRDLVEKTVLSLYFDELPNTKFVTKPSTKAPYQAGVLAPETLDAALNVLKLYRFFAGVPWQDLKQDPALSVKAGQAAILMSKSEKKTKKPERAGDMDAAFYNAATSAIADCVLHRGSNSPIVAVRTLMEDTENEDKSKLEDRQWLLSPALQKVGFGSAGREVAVDIADGNRQAKMDFNYVAYPGEGYFPTSLFDVKAPWSVFINSAKVRVPKESKDLRIVLQKLDDHFQPAGALIETTPAILPAPVSKALNWSVIVFTPDTESLPPARYWVEIYGIESASGSSVPFGYVVDLINIVVPAKVIVRAAESRPAELTPEQMADEQASKAKAWLGKTIPDVQFGGRACKMLTQEEDMSRTWNIHAAGEPTVIIAKTDPQGKIVSITVNGKPVTP